MVPPAAVTARWPLRELCVRQSLAAAAGVTRTAADSDSTVTSRPGPGCTGMIASARRPAAAAGSESLTVWAASVTAPAVTIVTAR